VLKQAMNINNNNRLRVRQKCTIGTNQEHAGFLAK